ncbi:hypothetical protein AMJ80_08540 [bacterium SM23_31]|nr:MAG: hypothetical protein AMJ80_08540 [bacterium SM23_31]
MKKPGIIWLLTLTVISLSFCRKDINGPDNVIINQQKNWVAVTGYFLKNSGHSTHIVLVDFYNPKNYKIITDTTMIAVEPRFSNDKQKILFGDMIHYGYGSGPQFFLYNFEDEVFQPLFIKSRMGPTGEKHIWNYDNSGFYFTKEPAWGFQEVLFYSFLNNNVSVIKEANGPFCVYVIGLKGQDTLIVFSNNTKDTGQPIGYYLMDLEGNYLSRINNTNLELINVKGINKKAAYNPNWNNKLGLFVYAQSDSTIPGYKISVTNLDGSYFRSYTSGEYIDDYPVWGPEGKYILFNRGLKRIMIIDVATGEVSYFLKPGDIPGSLGFRYPDY